MRRKFNFGETHAPHPAPPGSACPRGRLATCATEAGVRGPAARALEAQGHDAPAPPTHNAKGRALACDGQGHATAVSREERDAYRTGRPHRHDGPDAAEPQRGAGATTCGEQLDALLPEQVVAPEPNHEHEPRNTNQETEPGP